MRFNASNCTYLYLWQLPNCNKYIFQISQLQICRIKKNSDLTSFYGYFVPLPDANSKCCALISIELQRFDNALPPLPPSAATFQIFVLTAVSFKNSFISGLLLLSTLISDSCQTVLKYFNYAMTKPLKTAWQLSKRTTFCKILCMLSLCDVLCCKIKIWCFHINRITAS